MSVRQLDPHSQLLLLWVKNPDDLCDTSLVECWNYITAGGKKLQLECLWYCSLEHKVRHLSLSGVGGMDGDNCNIGIGVGPLKCELYFQAIFVVCRHWWNARCYVIEEGL